MVRHPTRPPCSSFRLSAHLQSPGNACRSNSQPNSCSVKNYDSSSLLPATQICKGARRVVDRISTRNEFIEFQTPAAIQADQPRKIQLRARRPVHASRESLPGGCDLLRAQDDLIL